MKFLELHARIKKIIKNLIIQHPNHENHEILRISMHNHETNENLIIHVKITTKNTKFTEFHSRIMNIIKKFIEFAKITKILKFLEFHARTMKIKKI